MRAANLKSESSTRVPLSTRLLLAAFSTFLFQKSGTAQEMEVRQVAETQSSRQEVVLSM